MLRSGCLASAGFLLTFLLFFGSGCSKNNGKSDAAGAPAITSREDSLMAVLAAAKTSAASGTSILRVEQIDSLAAQSENPQAADEDLIAQTAEPGASSGRGSTPAAAIAATPGSRGQSRSDTASTLEEAIKRNAILQVDSGSAEDLRLDSLMALANTKSYEYQRYVMTHTHTSLAAQAHQDITKQKRLLRAIAAKTDERAAAAQKAKFIRIQRQRELKGLPPLPDSLGLFTATSNN